MFATIEGWSFSLDHADLHTNLLWEYTHKKAKYYFLQVIHNPVNLIPEINYHSKQIQN